MNSNNEINRSLKSIKIVVVTLFLAIFILYKNIELRYYNTLVTNNFKTTNIKSNNKYSNIFEFYDTKNNRFYKS